MNKIIKNVLNLTLLGYAGREMQKILTVTNLDILCPRKFKYLIYSILHKSCCISLFLFKFIISVKRKIHWIVGNFFFFPIFFNIVHCKFPFIVSFTESFIEERICRSKLQCICRSCKESMKLLSLANEIAFYSFCVIFCDEKRYWFWNKGFSSTLRFTF